jgi:hypothetical protein
MKVKPDITGISNADRVDGGIGQRLGVNGTGANVAIES